MYVGIRTFCFLLCLGDVGVGFGGFFGERGIRGTVMVTVGFFPCLAVILCECDCFLFCGMGVGACDTPSLL